MSKSILSACLLIMTAAACSVQTLPPPSPNVYCEAGPGPGQRGGASVVGCSEGGVTTYDGLPCEYCQPDARCTTTRFGEGHCVILTPPPANPCATPEACAKGK